jgi:cyclophilin family peptidyl-prolyl cis-trans isomerase
MLRKSKIKRKSGINILTAVFLLFIFAPFSFSQIFNGEEKKILRETDLRNITGIKYDFDNLKKETENKQYSVQFLSLMNMPDSTIADSLISHFENSSTQNKLQIVKLLEYYSFQQVRDFLKSVIQNSDSPEIAAAAAYSLGNIGRTEDIAVLTSLSEEYRQPGTVYKISFSKAGALLMLAKRRISDHSIISWVDGKIDDAITNGYDHIAAYIYFRAGTKDNLASSREQLIKLSEAQNIYTRMWAFSALGKLQEQGELPDFENSLASETDWRVRLSIINALGNYPADVNSPLAKHLTEVLLKQAQNDPNEHVKIVSLMAFSKVIPVLKNNDVLYKSVKKQLRSIINSGDSWNVKAEAVKVYAKLFSGNAKKDLFGFFAGSSSYDLKAVIVSSFGYMEDPLVYKELRDTISAEVMRYNTVHPNKDGSMIGSNDLAKLYRGFVEALTSLDDKMDSENRNTIRLILSEFASSKDPILTDMCLTNLQDSIYMQYRNETCQIMTFDYGNFSLPNDREPALMYIKAWGDMKFDGAKEILISNLKNTDYDIAKASADALKNITGTEYEHEITAMKFHSDPDWEFIDGLNTKRTAVLKTNKGIIKIKLEPETAPFTVQNFVKLGEIGYYNNTIFHRVVPNFVIQGGDPTGTGYGGPGYSIRSEFSPVPFGPYSVGMASSGKDTEGSQFFITHSPQPHLDGKYTNFGTVTEGFDVVDKIQAGDKIESVTFSAE